MLRQPTGARRYNDTVTLTLASVVKDTVGHAKFSAPLPVLTVHAMVRQMSATKTMMTFQQADVIGLEIEMRMPGVTYNGLEWKGHQVHFSQPENVDDRGRIVRITGWYQQDNPGM